MNSEVRSPELDLVAIAAARCMVATLSGPAHVASAFGTPNVVTPGWMCGVPFALAQNFTFGRGAIPDDEHPAKLIVCWGINPNHTSGSLRRESFSAAMKAGAAYVPVDAQSPAARAAYILNDCQVKVVVTEIGEAW